MKYLLPLCFLASLFSCKTSKEGVKNEHKTAQDTLQTNEAEIIPVPASGTLYEALILGDWQWEKTICCGRTPHTETAESLSEPKILRFQPGGILHYFSGETKTADQPYAISNELLKGDGRQTITIGTRQPALLFIEGNRMIIDYGYIDLQQDFYVKIK